MLWNFAEPPYIFYIEVSAKKSNSKFDFLDQDFPYFVLRVSDALNFIINLYFVGKL